MHTRPAEREVRPVSAVAVSPHDSMAGATVRLVFPGGSAWLIAAQPFWQDPVTFFIGGDEVVVGFTEDFTTRIGLPG
ncbi:hypothetical protein [Planomonospora algeriensis]